MEINWLKRAEKENIPVFGICRGAQLMNVIRGGTLHPDISKVYEEAKYPTSLLAKIFFRKTIVIEPDTLFAKLFGDSPRRVNSMHTQSVKGLGTSLIQSAAENNGVIQAIEDPGREFFLGVQFHPELLLYRQSLRALFAGLVKAARKRREDPPGA